MLRNVPYKERLWKMKIKNDPLCQICHVDETIMHLYWNCPNSQRLWERLKILIEIGLRTSFTLNAEKGLLGTGYDLTRKNKDAINLMCTLTKHYLHLSKCNNTQRSTIGLDLYIKSTLKIERWLSTEKGLLNLFTRKWKGIAEWIDEMP